MKTLYLIMTIIYQLIIMKMMIHKLTFMTLKMNYQVTMNFIMKILLMKMIQILKLNIAQE